MPPLRSRCRSAGLLPGIALALALSSGPAWSKGTLHAGFSQASAPLVDGWILGMSPGLGYRHELGHGPWGLELRGSASGKRPLSDLNSPTPRLSSLAETLVAVSGDDGDASDFQVQAEVDLIRVEALVDVGPPRDRYRVQGVPHLRAGAFVEQREAYVASCLDDESDVSADCEFVTVVDDGTRIRPGLVAEFGHELWSARQVGVRIGVGMLAALDEKASYDPEESTDGLHIGLRPRFSVDLLFGVGGGQ